MQKHLFKFEKLIINRRKMYFHNLKYFPQILNLYIKYMQYLEDDFSSIRENILTGLLDYIEYVSPHFYLVLCENELCGFFALENIIGKNQNLYSAYVVTCFKKKYWGTFTKLAGHSFLKFCFEELGIRKLKAIIYPQNYRVRGILKNCGFVKEAKLFGETLKDGKPQDLEIYSVFNLKEKKCK